MKITFEFETESDYQTVLHLLRNRQGFEWSDRNKIYASTIKESEPSNFYVKKSIINNQ